MISITYLLRLVPQICAFNQNLNIMFRKTVVAAAILLAAQSMVAQTNPTANEEKAMKSLAADDDSLTWTRGGTIGFNTTFTYLNQWAAGGNNSISTTGLFSYFANYRKGKHAWDNSLDVAYGVLLQGLDSRAIKTDDKIDITSKYGRQASEKWFFAGLINFKTQFAPGFAPLNNGLPDWNRKISDFLAPGWVLGSIGMDYKPNAKLTAFISPITYRGIIVMDQDLADAGAFGVKRQLDANGVAIAGSGENFRTEMGAYARVQFATPVVENVNWTSKLELFSNYLEDPQNVDVSWENLISMKVNSFLTCTIFTHLIYDDNTQIIKETDETTGTPTNVGPGLQTKSIIGLGLSWKI